MCGGLCSRDVEAGGVGKCAGTTGELTAPWLRRPVVPSPFDGLYSSTYVPPFQQMFLNLVGVALLKSLTVNPPAECHRHYDSEPKQRTNAKANAGRHDGSLHFDASSF